MKRTKKYSIIFIFFISIILLFSSKSLAGDLTLETLDIEAQINYDGSMKVKETWDIEIEDTNTLYKSFKTDRKKYSEITDVTVYELNVYGRRAFNQVNQWAYHVKEDCYYGTFNREGNFEIGWGVGLEDSSAKKSYVIEYTVKDAIKKANDCAELYWQFIGGEFEIPIKNITGKIYLPYEVEKKEDLRVWGHTAYLNGTINAINNKEIKFEGKDLQAGTFFEVRVLFPTELISYSNRIENGNILESVIREETKWADEANAKRKSATIMSFVIFIIADLGLILLILKDIKYLKKMPDKYKPEQEMIYFREIPNDNRTPAEAYRLLYKMIVENFSYTNIGNAFTANLLNLNLKKAIDIIPDSNNKKEFTIKLIPSSKAEKSREEEIVYGFLENVSKNEELTLKELKKYIEKHPSKIEKLVENISKNVENNFKSQKLIIPENRKKILGKAGITTAILSLLFMMLIFGTIISMSTIRDIRFIYALILGIILMIADAIIAVKIYMKANIFTQEAVDEAEKWKALKKFMEEFSMLDKREVPEVVIWEKYLVFATAFGIADKVIKQLKIVYPNINNDISMNTNLNLYLAMNCNFNSSFSNSINTAMTSSLSSGSGSGGGFSGRRRWRPVAGGGGGGR